MGIRAEGSAVTGSRPIQQHRIAEARGARPVPSGMPTKYDRCMALTKDEVTCKMPVMKDGKFCVAHARQRGLTDVYENTD